MIRPSTLPLLAALVSASIAPQVRAQAAEPPAGAPQPGSPTPAPEAPSACCTVPDGTIVELEIAEPLSSKTAQRGQSFRLRLAEPLRWGTTEILPAGTEGVGEIIHADHSHGGGKPGELLLAARTLKAGAADVKLRGMKLGASGKDNSVMAIALSTAIGPFSLFVHGGEIEIPAGTRAHAKLSGAFPYAQAGATPADALPAPQTPTPAAGAPVTAGSGENAPLSTP